ncbi:MAG TPA: amino acid permease [Acidobacteriota bacterium]|jgi:amino acid transporter
MIKHPISKAPIDNSVAPTLIRALGTLDLTAVGINGVIGAGIFLIPATIASILGAASIWAYLAAGSVICLIVFCFAEAGSWIQSTGGPYVYARNVFGRFAGFQIGWMTWLARVAGLAALSNGFAASLGYFWRPAAGSLKMIAITLLFLFVTWINLIGVRFGKRVINGLTVAKLLPLFLFVAGGFFFVDWTRYQTMNLQQISRLGEGTLLLVFALTGWEVAVIPAEEVKNPRKSIPLALTITILFVTVFYMLIQLVAYGVLPGIENSATPLASAANVIGGGLGASGITLAALLSITGTCSGLMLAGPRMLYAFATEKDIPFLFAHVHPRYRTPHIAILVTAAVSLFLAYLGNFAQMAALAAIARLISYVGVCLAVPFLRRKITVDGKRFVLPGGWLIPALATGLSFWLIAHSTRTQFALALGAAGVGTALYLVSRRNRK